MMILVTLMTLMKVNRIPSLIRIDVFYSNDFREDEKNLLMVELARVRKEKELAKQKEVRVSCIGGCELSIGRREGTDGSSLA